MRGHTLMWHSQIGTWMYQDEKGNLLPKEEFYANMKHHIQAIVNRYKDVVYCWDVVNEAVADSPVYPGRPELRNSPMYQISTRPSSMPTRRTRTPSCSTTTTMTPSPPRASASTTSSSA